MIVKVTETKPFVVRVGTQGPEGIQGPIGPSSDHATLSNLQGGIAGERYHLTAQQLSWLGQDVRSSASPVFAGMTMGNDNYYYGKDSAGTPIPILYVGGDNTVVIGAKNAPASNGHLLMYAAGSEAARLQPQGNFLLGTAASGSSAAKVFVLGSGTAPGSSPADAVQVYSADQGGTAGQAALHVRGEDGSVASIGRQVLVPDGSATNPAFAFAASSNTGFLRLSNGSVQAVVAGAAIAEFRSSAFAVYRSQLALGSNSDVVFQWEAANALALRNGVNAQTFSIYNTYTDAANYEKGFLRWSSSQLQIGTGKAGTGQARQITFYTGDNERWILSPAGNLSPATTGAYDLGTSSLKIRDGWFSGSLIAGKICTSYFSKYIGGTDYLFSNAFRGPTIEEHPPLNDMVGNQLMYVDVKGATLTTAGPITSTANTLRPGDNYAAVSNTNNDPIIIEILAGIGSDTDVASHRVFFQAHSNLTAHMLVEIKKADGTWVTLADEDINLVGMEYWFSKDVTTVAPYPAAWTIQGVRFTLTNLVQGTTYIRQLGWYKRKGFRYPWLAEYSPSIWGDVYMQSAAAKLRAADNFNIYDTTNALARFAFSTSNTYTAKASGHHIFNNNVSLGLSALGTSADRVLAFANGTAPGSSPADAIQMWSADVNGVAGKASPHFRLEDGSIIKLYQQATVANADGTLADITTKFNTVLGYLKNLGLIA